MQINIYRVSPHTIYMWSVQHINVLKTGAQLGNGIERRRISLWVSINADENFSTHIVSGQQKTRIIL
ncbi:MAG TPA: hypothetical protein PL173_10630 [Saprospiraceae bacterium]|nr:hypothetical protein [Saprospiraceae bacterium]HNE66672.1 hypothetical protein [Saprospiraceae bacterium]HNG13526.1 hypothetical protein [Saprospiraceae bacterium]HNJ64124.1 hypothetical protein [Saprospiraceae bacterium]HNL94637.1 hypothetical protein [Saprospiraceae bacterium]